MVAGIRSWLAWTLLASALALFPATPGATAPRLEASPSPTWRTPLTFDVRSGSVAIDGQGNAYATGFRAADEPVAVIAKFDPSGALLWTRTWWQPRAHTAGTEVAVALDGSVYLAGDVGADHFEGGGWFLRKYDADGDLVWARDEPGWQHGRTSDSTSGLAVTGHTVLLAGSFRGCCGDLRVRDGWVLAFDRNGDRLWRNPFEATGIPEGYNDEAEAVVAGPAGAVYVAGWTALGPESEERAARHELVIQRLGPTGRSVWSRSFPATAGREQDLAADLAVRADALMVSALVDGRAIQWPSRPGHAWLARLTPSGGLVWSRVWGTSWTRAAGPSALAIGAKGRTFVVGSRRDPSDRGLDGFIRSFSPSGRVVWDRALQSGGRFVVGADVACRRGALISITEALDARNGQGVAGSLWRFEAG